MINTNKPCILFHIIEDKKYKVKNFSIELSFCGLRKINYKYKLIIDENIFPKSRDKFKTNIFLNVENKKFKFTITIYFGENHITIFKSLKNGVIFEIIQVYPDNNIYPLEKVDFTDENNRKISAFTFDTIGNSYKRRFLLVNFPINININLNKKNKMKENSSYKINLLPNDIIVQEIKESLQIKKEELKNFNKFNIIIKEIEEFIKNNRDDTDYIKMKQICDKLEPNDYYFNQNLMNKEDCNWSLDELNYYYYYYQFKLFINYATVSENSKITYYYSAMKIFKNIFEELEKMPNITIYEKICGILTLYMRLKGDCEHKENKNHLIGEYKLINMRNNKIHCYNLVYKFISDIINNLKENSFIFLPILQVNSGFNYNINSDDQKEIFELSMTNVNMVKNHLKLLLPNLLFLIRHPTIYSKRGSTCKATGLIHIYESSIFKNNIGKDIDTIITKYPKDAAVMISFVILHELFMHKKIRSNNDFDKGKETPSKFLGPKYDIKNFYYTNNKKNFDPLSVYNKDKENDNNIAKEGEFGKMFEYFLENENFEIINYLKKYIGFGDLLDNVDLIVDKNLDNLHSYILNKIKDNIAKPLLNEKSKKINKKKLDFNENDEDEIIGKEEEEEEEEEEESSEDEKSEETKRILSLQTD